MLDIDGSNAVAMSITQLAYGDELVTTEENPEGTGEKWSARGFCRRAVVLPESDRSVFHRRLGKVQSARSIWNESASTIALISGYSL